MISISHTGKLKLGEAAQVYIWQTQDSQAGPPNPRQRRRFILYATQICYFIPLLEAVSDCIMIMIMISLL